MFQNVDCLSENFGILQQIYERSILFVGVVITWLLLTIVFAVIDLNQNKNENQNLSSTMIIIHHVVVVIIIIIVVAIIIIIIIIVVVVVIIVVIIIVAITIWSAKGDKTP